jgi:hypothetical protein
MRLTHLTIRNIGHLADFDSPIPAVCLITGANGVGKSTILEALMYAAGRRVGPSGMRAINHDPTMLRGDANNGEIIARFDDPDGNLEYLRCTVTESKTGRYIKACGATAYAEAGSNLDTFFNALSYNPFALKAMEPKARIENILRIIPPAVTAAEIKAAVGDAVECSPRADISEIQRLHDDLFSERTGVNRDADTLEKQSKLLAVAPGVEDKTDWVLRLSGLRQDKATLEASEAEEITRIRGEFSRAQIAAEKAESDAKTESRATAQSEFRAIDADIDAKIKALEVDRTTRKQTASTANNNRIAAIDAEKQAYIESARNKANADAEEIQGANRPRLDSLTAEISAAETRAEVQLQAEGARNAAILTADKAVAARSRAAVLTAAIDRLRDLKTEVSKRMDLEGVTIAAARGGPVDLCRDEAGALVPFSRWNTRDKNIMCLRIALKAQAACGLVVIDSLGDFDDESLAELREACRAHADRGVSFLLGDATKGPLTVEEWK